MDSTLLLKVAFDVLGEKAIAIHAASNLLPKGETGQVKALAREIGVRLLIEPVEPLSWLEVAANPPDRCYHCKKRIYTLFREALRSHDIAVLMDGTNLDDLADDRPGLLAIKELGVTTPLAEAGLTKLEVRYLSRELGLSTWDRPSSSCLATRICSGMTITSEKILLVAQGEEYLIAQGFLGCRLRLYPDRTVLELAQGDMERLIKTEARNTILQYVENLGLPKILLDPQERPAVRVFPSINSAVP